MLRLFIFVSLLNIFNTIYAASEQAELYFLSQVKNIPKISGEEGEDAWYITEQSIGIADGVGGWADLGFDSGEYSRKLMLNAKNFANEFQEKTPKEILQNAYENMGCTSGTTTACIANLHKKVMHVANIGDSGLLVLRKKPLDLSWDIVTQTKEQQHYFNCPFQIGKFASDLPDDAEEYNIEIQSNDIVILATDGIFDNLCNGRILEILADEQALKEEDESYQDLADALAAEAKKISQDKNAQSPFSIRAQNAAIKHIGGKEDDITVIVAIIKSNLQRR